MAIPDSVKKIGKSAFWGCEGLETVIVPYSVEEVGEEAFANCDSLQKIVIPRGMTYQFKKFLSEDLWDRLVER